MGWAILALLAALGLTLYVALAPGPNYWFDGAAVAAWIGATWELAQALPQPD